MRTYEARCTSDWLSVDDDPALLSPRILLAEDDPEMRALVSGDLRRVGYGVVECADGPALLRRLAFVNPSDEVGIDLVVSDVIMPGLTGLEVLERLRRADPFTPFIIVTAFGSAEIRLEAIRMGAIAVLDKPFESKDLLHLIEDVVGKPPRVSR